MSIDESTSLYLFETNLFFSSLNILEPKISSSNDEFNFRNPKSIFEKFK